MTPDKNPKPSDQVVDLLENMLDTTHLFEALIQSNIPRNQLIYAISKITIMQMLGAACDRSWGLLENHPELFKLILVARSNSNRSATFFGIDRLISAHFKDFDQYILASNNPGDDRNVLGYLGALRKAINLILKPASESNPYLNFVAFSKPTVMLSVQSLTHLPKPAYLKLAYIHELAQAIQTNDTSIANIMLKWVIMQISGNIAREEICEINFREKAKKPLRSLITTRNYLSHIASLDTATIQKLWLEFLTNSHYVQLSLSSEEKSELKAFILAAQSQQVQSQDIPENEPPLTIAVQPVKAIPTPKPLNLVKEESIDDLVRTIHAEYIAEINARFYKCLPQSQTIVTREQVNALLLLSILANNHKNNFYLLKTFKSWLSLDAKIPVIPLEIVKSEDGECYLDANVKVSDQYYFKSTIKFSANKHIQERALLTKNLGDVTTASLGLLLENYNTRTLAIESMYVISNGEAVTPATYILFTNQKSKILNCLNILLNKRREDESQFDYCNMGLNISHRVLLCQSARFTRDLYYHSHSPAVPPSCSIAAALIYVTSPNDQAPKITNLLTCIVGFMAGRSIKEARSVFTESGDVWDVVSEQKFFTAIVRQIPGFSVQLVRELTGIIKWLLADEVDYYLEKFIERNLELVNIFTQEDTVFEVNYGYAESLMNAIDSIKIQESDNTTAKHATDARHKGKNSLWEALLAMALYPLIDFASMQNGGAPWSKVINNSFLRLHKDYAIFWGADFAKCIQEAIYKTPERREFMLRKLCQQLDLPMAQRDTPYIASFLKYLKDDDFEACLKHIKKGDLDHKIGTSTLQTYLIKMGDNTTNDMHRFQLILGRARELKTESNRSI